MGAWPDMALGWLCGGLILAALPVVAKMALAARVRRKRQGDGDDGERD